MRKGLVAIGVLTLIGGISYYVWNVYKQAQLLMDYCIKFKNVKFREIDRKKLILDVILDFKNNSELSILVSKYDLIITLNGIRASRIVYDAQKVNSDRKPIVIGPKKFSEIVLGVEIIPSNELSNWNVLSNILFDLNNTKVGFKGVVSIKTAGISGKNIPIDQVFKIKDFLPDPNAPKQPEKPCI